FAKLLTKVIPASLGKAPKVVVKASKSVKSARTTVEESLFVLADRVARNREIAGLHYPSDSTAGVTLAGAITDKILLDREYLPKFTKLVDAAKAEWEDTGVFE